MISFVVTRTTLSSPGGMALRKVCSTRKGSKRQRRLSEVFFGKELSVDLLETWLCTLEPV